MSAPSQMTFPAAISLRIIGRNHTDFAALVIELILRHVENLDTGALITRPSRDGNYVSVVLPLQLESKTQFDAVYRELNAHDSVIMVL